MSLFKEDNGNWSMTRLIVFFGSLWAMVMTSIALVIAVRADSDALVIGAIAAFFVSAMGVFAAWKTKSKQAESNIIIASKDEDDEPDGPDLG